jgi:diaminopimelate decarboxylase
MNFQKLTEQFETPLYVYDLRIIHERIDELFTTLGSYHNTKFLYAIKTNFNPHIVQKIIQRGCGIDAVSLDEVRIGLHCGTKKEDIMFTENNCTDEDMHEIMRLGVLINIGSLSRLEKFGIAYPGSRICIRFNPNVGAGSHETNITGGPDSKFGIATEYISEVKEIVKKYNLKVIGIHEHIGSGYLSQEEPLLGLETILETAKHFQNLEFVDMGGGFGVPYCPNESRLDLAELGEKIKIRFENFCAQYGRELELRFEPGRYIVAESGHLLTRVNTLKSSPNGKTFVGVDTGMNHLARVAMYDAYHPIGNLSNPNGPQRPYEIVGNICESADFFAHNRELSEVREGDILDIQIAGAYGMSMASHYQFRDLPAEILVDGNEVHLIRRRKTFEERIQIFEMENIQQI